MCETLWRCHRLQPHPVLVLVKNAGVDRGSLGCIGVARGSESTFTLASVRDKGMDFHRAIDASDMVVDSKQKGHLTTKHNLAK